VTRTLILPLTLTLACAAASPNAVTVAAATPTTTQTPAPPRAHALALSPSFEQNVAGDVRGVAVDHGRLYVNVAGALRVFDKSGPVAPAPHAWQPGQPLVVVGDGAFDPITFQSHAPPLPKGFECEAVAFSADASRMSAYCFDPGGTADATHVYDTRTGAELGRFDEFRTAAPIRRGTITTSGNFVFWVARANGAFEEIKSHVTGPLMSSHSVMSPNEDMLFTTVDKEWYSEDTSPARMLDPKNGRVLFELGNDVDAAWFSLSGGLFALRHSTRWADIMHASDSKKSWITVNAGATESARADLDEAVEAAFSRDGAEVAVRGSAGAIRVYAITR
jgi:hypothetical protein